MKSVKLILAALVMSIAVPASAQFANGGKASAAHPASYDRLSIGYDANIFSGKYAINPEDGEDGYTMNGFALQYTHAWSINKRLPVYVDAGLRLGLSLKSFDLEKVSPYDAEKVQRLWLSVPVNIAYRIPVSEAYITPYTGLHVAFNVLGRTRVDGDNLSDDDDKWYSFFDRDEFSKDERWKRLQFGWQIGAGVTYKAFYFGLEYGLDFVSLAKKVNTADFVVSVGYNF